MSLRAIKFVHTLIWTFFVAMIAAIWVFAARGAFAASAGAIGIVMIEVIVLGFNHGQCPLGRIAARHTDDRRANFDICLPGWLAARTKPIFGTLYGGAILATAVRWLLAIR